MKDSISEKCRITPDFLLIDEGQLLLKYTGSGGSVIIPDGVKCIASGVFQKTNVTDVTLPQGLEEIKQNAFEDCQLLTSVKLPDSLKLLGKAAFYGCVSLKKIVLPKGLRTIESGAFSHCTSLISVNFPKELDYIGCYAFASCTALAKLHLPEHLETISDCAFENCTALTRLYLPEDVTYIGELAFSDCTGLKRIFLPRSLTFLRTGTFKNCTSLTEVILPKGLQYIDPNAFIDCVNLTRIILEEGNTRFQEKDGLILTKNGKRVVACPTGWAGAAHVPAGVQEIGMNSFSGCRELTEVTLPDSLTAIKTHAFQNCEKLRAPKLPDNLVSIGAGAFGHCPRLTNLTLPASLQTMGDHAFADSPLAQVVFLGKMLKMGLYALGDKAFPLIAPDMPVTGFPSEYRPHAARGFALHYGESGMFPEEIMEANLKYIRGQRRRLWKDPPLLRLMLREQYVTQKDVATWLDEAAELGSPEISAMLLEYRNRHFSPADLEKILDREQNRQIKWLQTGMPLSEIKKIWSFKVQDDGTLIITSYKGFDTEIIVPDHIGSRRVTAIGKLAFSPSGPRLQDALRARRAAIRRIIFPEGITEIGNEAFTDCQELIEVVLPRSLNSLGHFTFSRCVQLPSLVIPGKVEQLERDIFNNCFSLEHIYLPAHISIKDKLLFHNCPHITIHARPGSHAERYARKNKIPFCPILPKDEIPESEDESHEH